MILSWRRLAIQFGFILIIISAGTIKLEESPPLGWDEGWTLNVARNWVESGHYGQMLVGQPVGPGQSASLVVVAPVALSFRLFGVGIWQGRLPSVLFMFDALALLIFLADRLFSRAIAWGTLFVAVFMTGFPNLNPLHLARTVMGEMPMLFYLLAGYTLLLLALSGPRWLILIVAILWGLALKAKFQALPFWIVSLSIPLVISLIKGWRPYSITLVFTLIITSGVYLSLNWIEGKIITPELNKGMITGLLGVTAIVPSAYVRLIAIKMALTLGLPTLLGLLFSSKRWILSFRQDTVRNPSQLIRLSLLCFTGSWIAWYILFSSSASRYLFPAVFVGSIFTSAWLYELSFQFRLKTTLDQARASLFRSRNRATFGALFTVGLVSVSLILTIYFLFFFFSTDNTSVKQIANFINTQTKSESLIESYESEIFFLLDRRYHYPPDDILVQIMTRNSSNEDIRVEYDPLSGDPDYLVIGPYGRWSEIYNLSLGKNFRLIKTFPGYQIYSRIR